MTAPQPVATSLLASLAEYAGAADGEAVWPARSWDILRQTGALRWCIPTRYGGDERSGADLLEGYEALASACLTTCFLLSQRDAACRRLRDSGNERWCAELLPGLARGERFATVGLSQLTTSRQHLGPALVARATASELIVDGTIPWVTGASQADLLVIGAVLDDGRQVLAVLPAELPGVSVGPPLDLMALEGSLTTEVRLANVHVDASCILAGPVERVLQAGRGGTGGLETSCLALGLAGAAIGHVSREAEAARPAPRWPSGWRSSANDSGVELYQLAEGTGPADAAMARHGRTRVLHATQAALTVSKGTGFLRQHPAQPLGTASPVFPGVVVPLAGGGRDAGLPGVRGRAPGLFLTGTSTRG